MPFVSQAALSTILQIARSEQLPTESHRWQLRASRDAICNGHTQYGQLHQVIDIELCDGTFLQLEVQHPFCMLHEATRTSKSLSLLIMRTYRRTRPTPTAPWRLVFYNDEVTPGNVLAHCTTRKIEACYWSVLDWGSAALSDEAAWFTLSSLRSLIRKKVKGGLSGFVAQLLKQLFFNDALGDMSIAGISLTLYTGECIHVWIDMSAILADEAAIHAMLCNKGASGLKPCSLCMNIFNKWLMTRRRIVSSDTFSVEDHTCDELGKLRMHTDDTIRAIIDKLATARPTMNNEKFQELQRVLGWTLVDGSLMYPGVFPKLKPASHILFDWMHVFFSAGIFNVHIIQLCTALQDEGISTMDLDNYVKLWHWPAHVGSKSGASCFELANMKKSFKANTFKCQASEGQSLCPVLATFSRNVLLQAPSTKAHGFCFLLLYEVVKMLQASARYTVKPSDLGNAIATYIRCFKRVYGPSRMIPKFHMAMHFQSFLERYGFLPNCTVLERKHKAIRRYANACLVAKSFDRTVMRDVTTAELAELQNNDHFGIGVALTSPSTPSKKLRASIHALLELGPGDDEQLMRSIRARINEHDHVSKGDVVELVDGTVGRIEFHVSLRECVLTFWVRYTCIDHGSETSRWSTGGATLSVIETSQVRKALIWAEADGVCTVLRPAM